MFQTHTDFDQAESERLAHAIEQIDITQRRNERLEEINRKQSKAIKDIHSLAFLNLDIPSQEREKILRVIDTVIRL